MKLTIIVTAVLALMRTAAADPGGRIVGTIAITEADGSAVTPVEAIVYVVGFDEPAPKAGAVGATLTQHGRRFVPDLAAITAGESIDFPNEDPFLHDVFSESPARKFDLGSFKQHEKKTKEFPTAGVVDVYCNIHPEMAATILVLPNTHHVHTAPDGSYVLTGVKPGTWTVFAYTRRVAKPVSAKVTVVAGADARLDLAVARGAPADHLNKYGEKYKTPTTPYH